MKVWGLEFRAHNGHYKGYYKVTTEFRVSALWGRVQRLGKQVIKVEGLRFMDMATVIADLIVSWLISVASGLLGFRV